MVGLSLPAARVMCLNLTIVDCKSTKYIRASKIRRRLNLTIVDCKSGYQRYAPARIARLNLTIVDCK